MPEFIASSSSERASMEFACPTEGRQFVKSKFVGTVFYDLEDPEDPEDLTDSLFFEFEIDCNPGLSAFGLMIYSTAGGSNYPSFHKAYLLDGRDEREEHLLLYLDFDGKLLTKSKYFP